METNATAWQGLRMFAGSKADVGVEVQIADVASHRWIYGTYLLWVDGKPLGNAQDESVDLRGCCNWMQSLIEQPADRYEPGLYEMDKGVAYNRLASSVLVHANPNGFVKETYPNTHSRFHISHIGMSSFDRVTLLWLKSLEGSDRLIWQSGEGTVADACFPAGRFESALRDAVQEMRLTFPVV